MSIAGKMGVKATKKEGDDEIKLNEEIVSRNDQNVAGSISAENPAT